MKKADLPEVLGIEVASFSLPWTEEMFDSELTHDTLAEVLVLVSPPSDTPRSSWGIFVSGSSPTSCT